MKISDHRFTVGGETRREDVYRLEYVDLYIAVMVIEGVTGSLYFMVEESQSAWLRYRETLGNRKPWNENG